MIDIEFYNYFISLIHQKSEGQFSFYKFFQQTTCVSSIDSIDFEFEAEAYKSVYVVEYRYRKREQKSKNILFKTTPFLTEYRPVSDTKVKRNFSRVFLKPLT